MRIRMPNLLMLLLSNFDKRTQFHNRKRDNTLKN